MGDPYGWHAHTGSGDPFGTAEHALGGGRGGAEFGAESALRGGACRAEDAVRLPTLEELGLTAASAPDRTRWLEES